MTIAREQVGAETGSEIPDLRSQDWDLLVVGGGTAGIVGAKTAASFGARVLLVERERTGGDCLWTGCVPSKSLLAAAAAAADARAATRFGIHTGSLRVDFTQVMAHVRSAIAAIAPTDSVEALEAAGVQVATGDLIFTGAHSADIVHTADFANPADCANRADCANTDGREVTFAQALVATGAAPAIPPIDGLASAGVLTSDTIWNLTSLPARLLVLGGGSIGCELGQAFARLGSQVTIVEHTDRVLPSEDAAASAIVAAALAHEGVQVLTGVPVAAVDAIADPGKGGRLRLQDGSHVDKRGCVVVDKHLRTTNRHIWATTPRVTFTHPEVAAVYPTYNDGLWNAAIADVRSRLNRPGTARATRVLAALRRRRVGGSAAFSQSQQRRRWRAR